MRTEGANRDSAPGRALVAVGLGLAAVAAVRPLSFDSRFVTYCVTPGLTFGLLWLSTSKLPAGPPGTRTGGHGFVAVLATLGSTLVPLSLVAGPVKVLGVALLVLGVRQRDLRLVFPAVVLAFLPVDVAFAEAVSTERAVGLAAASVAFVLAGTWGMSRGTSMGDGVTRADRGERTGGPDLVSGTPGASGGAGTPGR